MISAAGIMCAISPLYEASNNHTTQGRKEMLYMTGGIQVNSHCMTIAFIHFVALPLSIYNHGSISLPPWNLIAS